MYKQLSERLKELRADYKSGHRRLQELEAQVLTLRNNLLRMSGAIQVLEEEIAKGTQSSSSAPSRGGRTDADESDFPAGTSQAASGPSDKNKQSHIRKVTP